MSNDTSEHTAQDVVEDAIDGIVEIPAPALGLIASYLCIKDLYEFRLTCSLFYECSFYSEVLYNITVKVPKLKDDEFDMFFNFLHKIQYGRYSSMDVQSCNIPTELVGSLADGLKNVAELSIDIAHFEDVVKCCPYIRRLTLTSSLQNRDSQDDAFLLKQCSLLKRLERLEDLTVQGNHEFFDYSRFPAQFAIELSISLQKLRKVSFKRLFFVRDRSVENDVLCIPLTNIRSWVFNYVYIIGDFLLELPNRIDSVECFLAEDIRWSLENSTLKSLNLDTSSLPREWNDKNYKHLEHITFSKIKFLSMYPPLCKHIKSLHIIDCVHLNIYLKLISAFTDSLRKLTLEAVHYSTSTSDMEYYRDERIQEIVNNIVPGIEVLELRNFQVISPALFDGFDTEDLEEVIIDNCPRFNDQKVTKTYPFDVRVIRKCKCKWVK